MTETAWKKALRAVESKGIALLNNGCELTKDRHRYGYMYTLWDAEGNAVLCTWNLARIKELCIE